MLATVRPDLPYYIYSMVNTETLILNVYGFACFWIIDSKSQRLYITVLFFILYWIPINFCNVAAGHPGLPINITTTKSSTEIAQYEPVK